MMFVCHVCHVCVLERKMRKISVQTHVRVCVRKVEGIFYPCALKFAFSFCLSPSRLLALVFFLFRFRRLSSSRMKINHSFV